MHYPNDTTNYKGPSSYNGPKHESYNGPVSLYARDFKILIDKLQRENDMLKKEIREIKLIMNIIDDGRHSFMYKTINNTFINFPFENHN